jgi:kynurenine formamidase
MIATLELGGRTRRVDLSAGHGLAIPIDRSGRHPRFFTDQAVRFETLSVDGFTGRVTEGGSCNVDQVHLIPHCHGTHTEGVGHITRGAEPVQSGLSAGLVPAAVCSVAGAPTSSDQPAGPGPGIEAAALDWPDWVEALIVRTLPNDPEKRQRDYARQPAYPLLSIEAMVSIVERGIRHLLIDTPSVDAADDGGRLLQHRRFWGMGREEQRPAPERTGCTITEMIFVPDSVPDGLYLLSLGVGQLHSDASPSAPIVFPLQ